MKVLAKQVHALLRSELGSTLESARFSRIRGSLFAWTHEVNGQHLTLWAQCDKYGWDNSWGSTFTIEFQLALSPGVATGSIASRQRFFHLLNAEEREELRFRNNAIIGELPGSVSGSAIDYVEPDGTRTTIVGFRPRVEPYIQGVDVWMHYYTAEHILCWCNQLRGSLPHLVSRMAPFSSAS